MYFVQIAVRNLTRRPLRSFFTFLAVSVAVGSFLGFVGLSRGLEKAWTQALVARGTHVVGMPKGIVDIFNVSIDESIVREMAQIPGVAAVSGELLDLVVLKSGQVVLTVGWPLGSFMWRSVRLKEGRIPSEENMDTVIIGRNICKILNLGVGDTIYLRDHAFRVVGVSKQGDPLRNDAVVMPLKSLQKISNRQGKIATINLCLSDPTNETLVKDVISSLSKKFPKFLFTETSQVASSNKMIKVFHGMSWGTSVIALFIAVVVILNTLLMSVMERTREIGILNAVGWHPGRILSMIIIEGSLLAGAGGLGGTVFGVIGVKWLANWPQLRGIIYPSVDTVLLFEVGIATLALGLVGSVYPAIRAVLLAPAEALRYE